MSAKKEPQWRRGRRPSHLDMAATLDSAVYSELSCQSESLRPIAISFIRNMNRVRGLGILPVQLVAAATVHEAARIEALLNKGISIRDRRLIRGHPDFDTKLS